MEERDRDLNWEERGSWKREVVRGIFWVWVFLCVRLERIRKTRKKIGGFGDRQWLFSPAVIPTVGVHHDLDT